MKKTTKLIAILMVVALAAVLLVSAVADDKIYTSPVFKLPKNRIVKPVVPAEPETTEEPEATEEPDATEEPAAETADPEANDQFDDEFDPVDEPTEDPDLPEEGEQPTEPAADPEQGEDPAEPTAEPEQSEEPAQQTEPAEDSQQGKETTQPAADPEFPEEGEPSEEPSEEPGEEPSEEPVEEPAEPVREVRIYSSRKEVVTEGEIITLTSELIGFDDAAVLYQWQVDRNDGEGWVDVEGGNRWKHSFVANKETILYSWRLIVTVDE